MSTDAAEFEKTPGLEKSVKHRLAIFEENKAVAQTIAKSIYSKRKANDAEYLDYLHYAFIGLMEAVDRYDDTKPASFKTYASYRIRGSVLNGLEKFSEHREQMSFKQRLRQDRVKSLGKELRSTTKNGLFEEMVELTLGLAIGFILEGAYTTQAQNDVDQGDAVYNKYTESKNKESLLNFVKLLPENERIVIQFHYFYHTSFVDIANILKLTKGRVSQIHNSAIQKLKVFFEPGENINNYL